MEALRFTLMTQMRTPPRKRKIDGGYQVSVGRDCVFATTASSASARLFADSTSPSSRLWIPRVT
jgi:hypothetical protein